MTTKSGTTMHRSHYGPRSCIVVTMALALFLLGMLDSERAEAAAVGMSANLGGGSATLFDVNTHAVLGSVAMTAPGAELDCSLDGSSKLGYVSDFNTHIWVIDFAAEPPVLAAGINPIVTSILTEDTVITLDRRFLLTCDGTVNAEVSVIDLAARMEVNTFPLSGGCQGIDVCDDGSVLVVQAFSGIRRFTIDASGTLTDTGEALSNSAAFNTICGKGGTTAVVIGFNGHIQSFTLPGLSVIDTRPLPGADAMAGIASGDGNRIFIRTGESVFGFDYEPTTGALGVMPFLTIAVASTPAPYGVDRLALNPAGTELFVTEMNSVTIYSATSGAFVDVITDPAMASPIGLCTTSSLCGDGTAEGSEECDDGNLVDGDGCDSNCTLTACGNGVVTLGEECDDGNLANGDCCSSTCLAAVHGTPCNDGRFCNGTDTCNDGVCQHAGDPCVGGADCNDTCNENTDTCFTNAGAACVDDGNVCTDDQCDGAGVCFHPNNFFVPCDDGVFCNGTDSCFDGTCFLHNGNPCSFNACADRCDEPSATCLATTSGTPCFEDGNECTNDQCDGLGACVHPPQPLGTACTSDGDVCTLDQCNGAGGCSHPEAPDGTPCNDASACTQTDECQSGSCVGGDPVVCPAPLCHLSGTCDPATGTCSTCPVGYAHSGGGCQKTYAVDDSLLDNQDSSCSVTHRYNSCSGAFGFHWTDTADAAVGPVLRVDVHMQTGVDCDVAPHLLSLNGTPIGSFPAANSCTCSPSAVSRSLADVDTATYVKGAPNMVEISANDCSGLSRDAQGHYATVTVTYQDPGPAIAVREDCRPALKSKLKYKNDSGGDDDVFTWQWRNGIATTQTELADPTDTADYRLCVFGERDAESDLLIAAEVPADATLWRAIGTKGYKYKDSGATHGGVSKVVAKGGADGKAKIIVKGKGAALSDPTLPLAAGTSALRVQLTNPATDICWESEFPFGTVQADDDSIKGKVP